VKPLSLWKNARKSGTTNRIRLKEEKFLKIKIPVPENIEDQEKIINTMKLGQELGLNLVDSEKIKETLMQVLLQELFIDGFGFVSK
jgi:restriction endonuclease S subunit